MKEIKITEENYELYKECYHLKKHPSDMLSKKQNKILANHYAAISLAFPGSFLICGWTTLILKITASIYIPFFVLIGGFSIYGITINRFKKNNFKRFKENNPDLDTDVDVNELEKKLREYKRIITEKTIKNTKEEHLSNFNENFREMTTQERLELLNKEKEFWEQVSIQEQYQELQIEEKGIQKEYHN